MTVFAIGDWNTNADLIADAVVPLGYLKDEWITLDPTYGEGKWWTKWKPKSLICSDIDPLKSPSGVSVDFTNLPHMDGFFDAVAFDPPFKLNGRSTYDKDAPYGVHEAATRLERETLILDGMKEVTRVLVTGGILLVKVQDQVNGGKVRWQSDMCSQYASVGVRDRPGLGLEKVDSFFFQSYRPQPSGRRQLTARRNYSTLLVFRKR